MSTGFRSSSVLILPTSRVLTCYKRLYIGGDKLTSIVLNMLSTQLFVINEGILAFVSAGNKQFMDSKIAIRCPISRSSRHLSTKLIKYLVFSIIVNTILLMS
jgi:hypothetical protein